VWVQKGEGEGFGGERRENQEFNNANFQADPEIWAKREEKKTKLRRKMRILKRRRFVDEGVGGIAVMGEKRRWGGALYSRGKVAGAHDRGKYKRGKKDKRNLSGGMDPVVL